MNITHVEIVKDDMDHPSAFIVFNDNLYMYDSIACRGDDSITHLYRKFKPKDMDDLAEYLRVAHYPTVVARFFVEEAIDKASLVVDGFKYDNGGDGTLFNLD